MPDFDSHKKRDFVRSVRTTPSRPKGSEVGVFVFMVVAAFVLLAAAWYFGAVSSLVALVGVLAVLLFIYSKSAGIVIEVEQYERAVILRYGKFNKVAGPGWVLLLPFIDEPHVVDLRVFTANIQPQRVITKDNIVITLDAIVFLQVTDPKAAVLNITDPRQAAQDYIAAHLRDIVGKMELESVIGQIDLINRLLSRGLEKISKDWGISVVKTEIQRLELPEDVKQAMHDRKAAEQQKYAAEELAKAQAIKIDAVREAAGKLTDPALNYLYLQALEKVSEGRSSKIIFPIELTHLAERLSPRLGKSTEEVEDELREKYNELLLEKGVKSGKADKKDIIKELKKRAEKKSKSKNNS
jgi:regulator of protease activity HflC (stomatin/prohibitin superfamily)